jgi:DNA-binding NarL/FixJ family response regulator
LLVVDDQAIDRAGLVAMLGTRPDFAVVGEASTADEMVRACLERRPTLIILSLSLPSSAGMTALSVVRGHFPEIPVLAVAQRGEAHCMVLNPQGSDRGADDGPNGRCTAGTDCLELAVAEGASGTIRRSAAPEDLFGAIRAVASGKAWYEAGTAAAIMRHALARLASEGAHRPLSKREIDVSRLIADGRSNKEIARALAISEPTVKKHVGHILAKLNLQDRLQVGIHLTRNPLLLRASGPSQR